MPVVTACLQVLEPQPPLAVPSLLNKLCEPVKSEIWTSGVKLPSSLSRLLTDHDSLGFNGTVEKLKVVACS